jgi:hypothetical protein
MALQALERHNPYNHACNLIRNVHDGAEEAEDHQQDKCALDPLPPAPAAHFFLRLRAGSFFPFGFRAISRSFLVLRPVRVFFPARFRESSAPKNFCWAFDRAGT